MTPVSVPDVPDWLRYPTMLLAFLTLVLAIFGGFNRIGFQYGWVPENVNFYHGGLMVSGFLGTVIALERAVSLPIKGSLLVPATNVLGALILLVGGPPGVGLGLFVLASLGLLGLFGYIYRLQPSLHNLVLVLGGVCWIIGNIHWWWGNPVPEFVPWWMGFLVFVIAAERLELNRLKQFDRFQKGTFLAGIILGLNGMVMVPFFPSPGTWLYAGGFLVISLWLVTQDMVRHLLFSGGERGYTGWCLFSGYLWLGAGAILRIVFPEAQAGLYYDAFLHSIFLGFVFTMIFGHAFIIMPGVLNLNLPYHGGFFVPLILLEGTLVLRVAGDLFLRQSLREWSGLGNGVAIGLFFLMLVETVVRSRVLAE